MIGFELLRPSLAWLLVLAPLALIVGWRGQARARAERARWVAERHLARFLPGVSSTRARRRVVLGALGLFFLGLAALGPVRGYTYRAVSRKGLDLVVCLDTSRSMLAQDLRPSRLERAKREILGLLDHMKDDRVALVAFSGDARDVAPLTRDRQTLEGLLSYVTPEDNQEGGTDLAAAVAHALSLFDGRTGAHEAIVLLTDGEDLEGKAQAQAEEARKRGIRLFVVGVGTEAGGKIPVLDAQGRPSFLRDPEGNEVVTKLGRESLATLAGITGGDYLSAEEAPTALEDLYRARIARIQGRESEGGERRVPYDRYQWPLALALLCFLAELLLRPRPRAAARAGSTGLAAAFLPWLGLLGQEPFSAARSLESAVSHHRAGEEEEAEAAARAILEHADELRLGESERARAHFALGLVAATRALDARADDEPEAVTARIDAAREAFSAARALAGPGELRRDATYDLGALELFLGERLRATLPEISGQGSGAPAPGMLPGAGAPVPGLGPVGAPGADAPPPDALKPARERYRAAREWLLERLRLDWQDEDTRANLELVQRRLHELDEIEKKREEEQKKDQQQDQQPDPNQDSKDGQDPKDSDSQDPEKQKQDPEKKPDKQDDSQQDQEANPDEPKPDSSQDPKDPQEDKADPPQEGEKTPEEAPPKPEGEPEQPEEAGTPPEGQPKEAEERLLTREQVMQLLDKLGELEKQQSALEAMMRARRRAATKRDW